MRLGFCALIACLATTLSAGQGKGKNKPQKAVSVNVDLRFGSDDTRRIYDYYHPKVQQLPPGLQKKVARGGTLPPGWQKKLQPFPVELNARLAPLPSGYRRVVSGQVAMLIYDATNTVLDIIELAR